MWRWLDHVGLGLCHLWRGVCRQDAMYSNSLPRQSAPEATPALVSRMRGFRSSRSGSTACGEHPRIRTARGRVRARPAARRGAGRVRGGSCTRCAARSRHGAEARRPRPRRARSGCYRDQRSGSTQRAARPRPRSAGGCDCLDRSAGEKRPESPEHEYRGERLQPEVAHRTVVLVDDGLATGATMLAAIRSVRARDAERVVVAVPVAPRETCAALRRAADVVACLITPANFRAVSAWYDDFSATTDDQVRELLRQCATSVTRGLAFARGFLKGAASRSGGCGPDRRGRGSLSRAVLPPRR